VIGQNNPELVDYIPDFLKKSGIYLSRILKLLLRLRDREAQKQGREGDKGEKR
jgi:hypothetical protein